MQYGAEYYYRLSPAEGNASAGEYTAVSSLTASSARVTVVTSEVDFLPVSVTVFGEYAYIPAGDKGLRILDVSDPAGSFLRGSCMTGDAKVVAFRGDFAYLADARGLEVKDKYVFLTEGENGLVVIDALDPTSPQLFDEISSPGELNVGMENDFVLPADVSGLRVIRTYFFRRSFQNFRSSPGRKTSTGISVEGARAFVSGPLSRPMPGVYISSMYPGRIFLKPTSNRVPERSS